MFLKGALICLLAVWIEIDAAKKGKFLKKLAKPNELGYQLENAVKSNLKDDVSANNASISALLDKFNGLQADCNASITSNKEDISTLMDKHDSLEAEYNASITSNKEDISTLMDKHGSLEAEYNASITSNKEDISTLMDKLDSLQSDYISLRADYNALKAGIQTNGDKVNALKVGAQINAEKILSNAEGILANTNVDTTLADNITSITADISNMDTTLTNNIASNLAKFTNIIADISNMDTTLVSQGSRLLDLETMGSGSVWFDAIRESNFDAFQFWTKITYDNVRQSTNYQAMNKGTGVFTAPLAGTYQFIIQAYKYSSSYGNVRIVVDGTTVSTIYDSDDSHYRTLTGTAIIEMQPGQKAWAETFNELQGYYDGRTHFSGVLITPK